jgi:hypothetical protein
MTRIREAVPGDVEAITALTDALIATTTIEWRGTRVTATCARR